jgi:hypothetical protein
MMALLDVGRRPGRLLFTRRASSGRHRRGRPTVAPERLGADGRGRVWDAAQRVRAEQFGLLEPGWLVIYGPYSRRFHAIARTAQVAEPLIDAPTLEELRGLMRESEFAFLVASTRLPVTAREQEPGGDARRGRWL